MFDLHAPDGASEPVNTQTVQYPGTLLPFSTAIIWAGGNAAWEQAGVVYINGIRQAQLIGNYDHSNMFFLGERAFNQEIAVAGWHKRSGPDGGQPWVASRGRVQAGMAGWDDSGGDADFDDLTAWIQRLTGTVHTFAEAGPPSRSRDEAPSRDAASVLKSVANLKTIVARMPEGREREALADFVKEAFSNVVANYHASVKETEFLSTPISPSVVLRQI